MQVSRTHHRRPRLCFVGPMVGRNPGYVTTQGQKLADSFAAAGYTVLSVSSLTNRYRRFSDIVMTLLSRRKDYDVVVLDVFGGPSFVVEDVASRITRMLACPLVMVLRGGAMPEFMARHPRWSRKVLSRADAIITPSQFLKRGIGQYGFTGRIIPNTISLSAYPYRRREKIAPRLLWMRCFHPIYNPAMALRVLRRIRDSHPEATLVMAGEEKGLGKAMQEMAAQLGLAEAVRFPGFLDPAGKAREGALADIFINTNHIDNTPVGVLEACAMGMPVIATKVGGIPDLLKDGETALLVDDDDDATMSGAVETILSNPELAARLSDGGRTLAESSSWQRVQPLWEKLFEELLSARSRAVAA